MVGALLRFVLYRLIGGRLMLGLAILGLARRLLAGRRDAPRPVEMQPPDSSTYQPSHGESQTVQREPR